MKQNLEKKSLKLYAPWPSRLPSRGAAQVGDQVHRAGEGGHEVQGAAESGTGGLEAVVMSHHPRPEMSRN